MKKIKSALGLNSKISNKNIKKCKSGLLLPISNNTLNYNGIDVTKSFDSLKKEKTITETFNKTKHVACLLCKFMFFGNNIYCNDCKNGKTLQKKDKNGDLLFDKHGLPIFVIEKGKLVIVREELKNLLNNEISFNCVIYEIFKLALTDAKWSGKKLEDCTCEILNYSFENIKVKEELNNFHYKLNDFKINTNDDIFTKYNKITEKRNSNKILVKKILVKKRKKGKKGKKEEIKKIKSCLIN